MSIRAGTGYDIHKLVEGRKLILGGVEIPFEKGLLGHSDGDALLHTISDSMLGALALGDIGNHFPDDDPKYKDADSLMLMKSVHDSISAKGWKIVNIDANVIAEKPKMAPYIDAMRSKIAGALEIDKGNVSVKARTNEGLGEIGRGEAIEVHAVVLLEKNN